MKSSATISTIKGYTVGQEYPVNCLCIDIVGSTQVGIDRGRRKRGEFFVAVADQIEPYLKVFDLSDATVKCTGDGWLIMQPGPGAIRQLVSLGKTLCNRFRIDIAKATGLTPEDIPGIRASLFSGGDIAVSVPTGSESGQKQLDWFGDSARRASRFNICADENGLIVDYVCYDKVYLDFNCRIVDLLSLPEDRRPKRMEEEITFYRVEGLKPMVLDEICTESCEGYEYYALYLNRIGEKAEAERLVANVHTSLGAEIESQAKAIQDESNKVVRRKLKSTIKNLIRVTPLGTTRDALTNSLREIGSELNVVDYNSYIARSPDYAAALDWYDEMTRRDLSPDEVTYSTLIKIAPGYAAALDWYDEMTRRDLSPNEVTYSTLINIAPDYAAALDWYDEMTRRGLSPDEVTYNTLIKIAPGYAAALDWYDEMARRGLSPDEVTYSTLIKIAPDYAAALDWYDEMTRRGLSPNEITHSALVKKSPDLSSALDLTDRLIKSKGSIGLHYFSALFAKDVSHLSGEELLRIYDSLPLQFESSLEPAMKTFLSKKKLNDALWLCSRVPHLPAAIRIYREKPAQAVEWFRGIVQRDPESPNGVYGLGICLFHNERFLEAEPHLHRARALAVADRRREHIDRMLLEIEKRK